MGNFNIQRARGTLPGRATQVRADLDVRTGGQQIAQAISALGGAAADLGMKWDIMQAETQLAEAKRLTREEINRLSLSFEGNLNSDTFQAEYKKSLDMIKNFAPKNRRASRSYNLWLAERSPYWQEGVNKSRKARIDDNYKAEGFNLKAEAERTGDVSKYRFHLVKGKLLGIYGAEEVAELSQDTRKRAERNVINQLIRNGETTLAFETIERAETLLPAEKTALENSVTNRILQLRNLSNEAFDDRAGKAVEGWFNALEKGTLTEGDIADTDLQAVGEQKATEVTLKRQWQKIVRDTIKLQEPLVSNESVYDSLVVGSEQVERGTKSPAEWDLEYAQAWANGKLEKEDRRGLRIKDIVATKTMQNRAFSEGTINNLSRLVELRDDELSGLIAARDNALKLKDLQTVNALNFSIKKAQIQKWNYGKFRMELRSQITQNEGWSQKQIFAAADILVDNHDKPIADLMLEFEKANPNRSILKTPPDIKFKDIWKELPDEDKAKIWELRLMGVPVKEILGAI